MRKLKILYLATQNYTNTLSYFKNAHIKNGFECENLTYFKSDFGFDNGICLNLPLMPDNKLFLNFKKLYQSLVRNSNGDNHVKSIYWKPNNLIEKAFFKFRDSISEKLISEKIERYKLYNYDIYHFEGGADLFRDSRFIKELKKRDKKIVCCYHGVDIRERGLFKDVDLLSALNLTSELDLINLYPNLNYLFLPFYTKKYTIKNRLNNPIKICHATRNKDNWKYKGSDVIIQVCRELEKEHNIVFHLIENLSHKDALKIKNQCDIYIDQISNEGGWGYGMNSVEALSMGLCCCTNLVKEYEDFIPDHPFVNVNTNDLKNKLIGLIENPEFIIKAGTYGKAWVEKYHDISKVMGKLYEYYEKYNII